MRAARVHFSGNVRGWLAIDREIGARVAQRIRAERPQVAFCALTGIDKTSHSQGHSAQVVRDGAATGRVTSARVSERLGKVIGLAWVEPERAEEGKTIAIRIDGVLHEASITLSPFYDREGALLRS